MAQTARSPTTLYLDRKLAKAAKIKAAITGKSLSDLANEGLARLLHEDEAILRLVRARRKERGSDYEEFIRDLRRNGDI